MSLRLRIGVFVVGMVCLFGSSVSWGQEGIDDLNFENVEGEGHNFRSGVVKPVRKAILSFAQSGFLMMVPEEGQEVKEDEVIARLDSRGILIAIREAEAALETKQLSLETARHKFNKTKRLVDEKILAPIALVEDEFVVKKAVAELKVSKAKLETQILFRNEYSLLSPFSGIILNVTTTLGEQVAVGQPVAELVDLSLLQINLDIPLSLTKGLVPGVSTEIVVDGESMGIATVKTVLPMIDAASGLQHVIWTVVSKGKILAGRYVTLSPWENK